MAVLPESFGDLLTRLQLDLTGFANQSRVATAYAPLYGRELTGTIPAGDTIVTLKHGLGRVYRGMDVRHADSLVTPLTAESPASDSGTLIRLYLGASQLTDVTFTVWVY